jgi:hypothetical protein
MNKIKKVVITSLICTSGFIRTISNAQTLNYEVSGDVGVTKSVCDGFGTCSKGTGQMQINAGGLFCMEYNPWIGTKSHQVAKWINIGEPASVSWGVTSEGITLTNAILLDPNMVDGGCPMWG